MSGLKRTTSKQSPQPTTISLSSLLRFGCYFLLGLVLAWSMFQPMDSTSVFDGSAMLQNLAWFVLAVLVSLEAVVTGRRLTLSKFELLGIVSIMAWLLMVTINASYRFNPRTGWNGFWHVVSAVSLYYSVRTLVQTALERSAMLCVILAGAITLSGVGIYQVTIAFPEMRQQFFSDPDKQLMQMGIDAPEGSPTRKRLEDRLNSPEPYATFSLANSLAVLLSGAIVGAIGALAFGLGLRWLGPRWQVPDKQSDSISGLSQGLGGLNFAILAVACFLMGCVWFLTRSRVAIAAVPLTLLLMLAGALWQAGGKLKSLLRTDLRQKLYACGTVLLLLFVAGVFWLWRRDPQVFTEATKSLSYRFEYWQATGKIIQQYPWFGVGLGNFQSIYPKYMLPTASETIADPHNWILDLASCCSLPLAVVIFVGVLSVLIRKPVGMVLKDGVTSSHQQIAFGAAGGSLLVILGLYIFGQEAGLLAAMLIMVIVSMIALPKIFPLLSELASRSNLVFKAMAIAMLLCLLISGSWQASGLICPLLILLALSRDADPEPSALDDSPWLASVALLTWLAFVAGFILTSWKPVLSSQAEVARTFSSFGQQLEAIERAGRLDPLNAEWDRYRAKLLVEQAVRPSERDRFQANAERALVALENWTAREPMSFLTWQFAGDRCLELASFETKNDASRIKILELAAQYYDQAVQARPNSVQLHLQLAYSLALLGKFDRSAQELEKAQILSDLSPHVDQKTPAQLLWTPTGPTELSPPNGVRPYSKAELVVDWIRKQSNP